MVPDFLSQNLLNVDMISWTFKTIFHSGRTIFEFILSIVLIPVLFFYFLCGWQEMLIKILVLAPKKKQRVVIRLAKECDLILSAFFRGQLLVMLSLCIYYSVALSILRLKAAIILGIIIGIISILPYIGAIIGILLVGIIALVQFGTLKSLLWVGLIFLVGHAA